MLTGKGKKYKDIFYIQSYESDVGLFGEIFREHIRDNPVYEEVKEVTERNSTDGAWWVIGRQFFEPITEGVHGEEGMHPSGRVDWDVLIKEQKREVYVPKGYEQWRTNYGDIEFVKPGMIITLNDLQNWRMIALRNLKPKLIHFLTSAPLTIHSMVFDAQRQEVIARKVAYESIRDRKIKVNYPPNAEEYARSKGLSVAKVISKLEYELGFRERP